MNLNKCSMIKIKTYVLSMFNMGCAQIAIKHFSPLLFWETLNASCLHVLEDSKRVMPTRFGRLKTRHIPPLTAIESVDRNSQLFWLYCDSVMCCVCCAYAYANLTHRPCQSPHAI